MFAYVSVPAHIVLFLSLVTFVITMGLIALLFEIRYDKFIANEIVEIIHEDGEGWWLKLDDFKRNHPAKVHPTLLTKILGIRTNKE